MAKSPKTPIIIIQRKVSHGGHHGGAWKVAYADFVTAMMALFIVLWLMNSSAQVQQAVGGYFKDPSGTGKKTGSDVSGSGESLVVSKDNMAQLKEELQKMIQQTTNLDQLKKRIEMTVTGEGLRIELLESETGTFFQSAKAQPTDDGREALSLLAQELKKLPNTVSIEGHTDAKPFSNGGSYGNWELSADHANTARRILQDAGVRPEQISQIRGYASQRLRNPKEPEDPSNRRISLIVQYRAKP